MTVRKALLALLAAIPASISVAEAKGPTIYTVAKVAVAADADDAVAAKEKALAQAQQIALRALLSRMTPWNAHAKLPVLSNDMVERMVEGFAVRRESNSSTRYIATLDFSFEPNAVRDILNRFALPYTDQQAPRVAAAARHDRGRRAAARARKTPGTRRCRCRCRARADADEARPAARPT